MRYKSLFIALTLMAASASTALAQHGYVSWGTSHPSLKIVCDSAYMYPIPDEGEQFVLEPCPGVKIRQTHDHTSRYRINGPNPGAHPWSNNPQEKGWDTAITCKNQGADGKFFMELSCQPYIPVQYFNGYYAVDTIPFDPPMPFDLGYPNTPNVIKMQINNDDDYAAQPTPLNFPFFFFGEQKFQFRIGDNGIVNFTTTPMTDVHYNGPFCPYGINNAMPWNTSNSSQAPGDLVKTNNAIYGVYEDTYTGSNGSYMSGNQGIYYGVVGEWPCRKIIASWNQIPIYDNNQIRETYQIVCYEGSNIIEVHVQERNCCPSTSKGIIGIQNATGLPQQPGPLGSSTMNVLANAPAAFWPVGKNLFQTSESNTAYRFTPQGGTTPQNLGTQSVYEWFRILDNGDTAYLRSLAQVTASPDPSDSNGYYYPMGQVPCSRPNGYAPTLTKAVITPTITSRYYFHLKFQDANEVWHDYTDSTIVGIDKEKTIYLHAADSAYDVKFLRICAGTTANLKMEFPTTQEEDTTYYFVKRRSGGVDTDIPTDNYLTAQAPERDMIDLTTHMRIRNITVNVPETDMQTNRIDSVFVQVFTTFGNGCENSDTIWVLNYPNFDTTVIEGICQGEVYTWSANNRTYNVSTMADTTLKSAPGCDSTVHLRLTVFDRSYNIDHITDCRPYTWINGLTYYESNNATAAIDTVQDTNRWGCDSTVQLEFTMLPVKAHIQCDREYFDFDHLDAVLTDVSENNHVRSWVFPGGYTLSGPVAYYTIPAEYDEAEIQLFASATYGDHTCTDSTSITIPLRKESFWVPNIFTPESASGNNLFGSISTRTLTEEMYIYNRNGQLIFHCEEPDCKWDGRDASGNLCPQGTYTYLIRYTNEFLPKVVHVLRGTVTLIR